MASCCLVLYFWPLPKVRINHSDPTTFVGMLRKSSSFQKLKVERKIDLHVWGTATTDCMCLCIYIYKYININNINIHVYIYIHILLYYYIHFSDLVWARTANNTKPYFLVVSGPQDLLRCQAVKNFGSVAHSKLRCPDKHSPEDTWQLEKATEKPPMFVTPQKSKGTKY